MTDAAFARQALAAWDLPDAQPVSVLHRENTVWRITSSMGDFALRIHRRGLRQATEIAAELGFMAHLAASGLSVPAPQPCRDGALWIEVDGLLIDLLTWVPGTTLSAGVSPETRQSAYRALGQEMARLHHAADGWARPAGFNRPVWDLDGLTGPKAVWGEWQGHPGLDRNDLALLSQAEARARADLAAKELDFGPIHADLVIENVLYDQGRPWLIDFDDFGTGYRLFDLATVLLRAEREPDFDIAREALLKGYSAERGLDLTLLPQMLVLRSLTYLGWIIPRLAEQGGAGRSARFVARARRYSALMSEQQTGKRAQRPA